MPKISIVLPVYNGLKYLDSAIYSILNQTEQNYEVLICDDASTDGSLSYLKQLENLNHNVRILYNDKNLGLFKTLNKLIKACQSPLIHLWAQDDIMMPNCLEECLNFHNLYPNITMSYHGVEYIDENGLVNPSEKIDGTPSIIDTKLYAILSSKWGCIPGNISNITINTSSIIAVGLFDDQMTLSADFDLWTKLAAVGDIGRIPYKLTYLRLHAAQLSRNYKSIALRIEEDTLIQKRIIGLLAENKDDFNIAKRFWRWKTQPTYFNDLLYLISVKEYDEGKKLAALLYSETNIIGLFFRWSIVRTLRFLKLDIKFYLNILDR
ncbi:glycosyltransferase involved in cell wall biosynthesis [Pedobacter sp. W3I1]|uniref:glycosyltransferase family 2 protein n=1 Tax=Pedobacter sp. W3I1 TaxID=3042291 RepID=UPI002780A9EB|nr:glycosyltransferase [Pedobacter sp. W3I1]MDQ0640919.1 glycosyltransferase involved in cell wall biosynthesis [Pedobacter sp. W3I1]